MPYGMIHVFSKSCLHRQAHSNQSAFRPNHQPADRANLAALFPKNRCTTQSRKIAAWAYRPAAGFITARSATGNRPLAVTSVRLTGSRDIYCGRGSTGVLSPRLGVGWQAAQHRLSHEPGTPLRQPCNSGSPARYFYSTVSNRSSPPPPKRPLIVHRAPSSTPRPLPEVAGQLVRPLATRFKALPQTAGKHSGTNNTASPTNLGQDGRRTAPRPPAQQVGPPFPGSIGVETTVSGRVVPPVLGVHSQRA